MTNDKIEVYAGRSIRTRRIDITVRVPTPGHPTRFGNPVTFSEADEEFVHVPPTLSLPFEAAQQLMDELWNAGIRPVDGTGNVGQTGAMANHLNDMRAIAFNALKLPVIEIKK